MVGKLVESFNGMIRTSGTSCKMKKSVEDGSGVRRVDWKGVWRVFEVCQASLLPRFRR